MGLFKPKSCCGCLTLREGVAIILLIIFIDCIYNLYKYGYSYSYEYAYFYLNSNLVTLRYMYMVKGIINLIFVFISSINVCRYKASTFRIYIYYLVIDIIASLIINFILVFPFIFDYTYLRFFIDSMINIVIDAISIILFNAYYDQVRRNEKDISTIVLTV